MKKRKIIIALIGMLFLTGLYALARNYRWIGSGVDELPDARQEIEKIYSLYNKQDTSFTIRGVIRLLDSEKDNAVKEVTPFVYTKHQAQYYSSLGYVQTLCANGMGIQLDTVNRYIVVSRVDPSLLDNSQNSLLPFTQFMQDTATYKTTIAAVQKGREYAITITSEASPDIKKATIFYHPATYRIIKSEIEWWKSATAGLNENEQDQTWVTRIEYEHTTATGETAAERINKIVVSMNGKIEPAPAYRGYEFQSAF